MQRSMFIWIPVLAAGLMLPEKKEPVLAAMEYHTTQLDGPYVQYRGEQVFVNYILDNHGTKQVKQDSLPVTEKDKVVLTVATDEPGKTFTVKLKKVLEPEKNEYSKISRMFVVSDIEGNFRALRRILQANQVVDANLNWTWGNGHLVLTGDFVDRGEQQTEVLWFIYALEEQAKAAGGYVHYILGNHEIMNLSGDLRYLHAKYNQHAALLNERFVSLLGENSELGRWLRTKNVIEKVGDVLFCHGGISAPVNRMDLSTSRINKLVRPFYADSTAQYNSAQVELLYSDYGPFWYRGYYYGTKATQAQVDSTLWLYRAKYISTGHTVIADTISMLYEGKVINTDVHHAKGHQEGLLVEGGKFYRVNTVGEKFLMHSR